MEQSLPEINYKNLSDALEFYKAFGYEYVEVPWIVPRNVTQITLNTDEVNPIEMYEGMSAGGYGGKSNGDLVGSAEQGFLYLMEQNKLEHGDYCALTPCFRKEQYVTNLHRPYFMKVELCSFQATKTDCKPKLKSIIDICYRYFKLTGYTPDKVSTPDGIDFMLNGIEIGSYGIRSFKNFHWVYGTGLAEPRFQQATQQKE